MIRLGRGRVSVHSSAAQLLHRTICSGSVVQPEPARTHDVFNQSKDLGNMNVFTQDPVFSEAAKVFGADWAVDKLAQYGEVCGSEEFREDARQVILSQMH